MEPIKKFPPRVTEEREIKDEREEGTEPVKLFSYSAR
jgi:hypothetical protein